MALLEKYLQTGEKNSAAISFYAAIDHIAKTSPKIAENILSELKDQRTFLKLIASENYSSLAVQLTMGNLLTDKYSEGFPGHRFYEGCHNVDMIESMAIDLAKKIYHADHAYVQPASGAAANLIAYWAILVHRVQNKEIERLGKKNLNSLTDEEYEKIRKLLNDQKVMGMSLMSGGHLTHGYRHNISSKIMQSFSYDVDPNTGLLDYAELQKRAKEVKPLILIAGFSAYPRKINFAKMKEIADSVGAVLLVDMAHFAGLVAGKVFTGEYDPIPFADIVTSTTHKTLRGPRGGLILCKDEYKDTVNKGCPLVIGGPMPHVIAAKAVAFQEALEPSFASYASQIVKNSQALAKKLEALGSHVLTRGTDNHIVLMDVEKSYSLTGKQAEHGLYLGHLTVNRNTIPNDMHGAWFTSGIRIGTPAMTTLGMKEVEMEKIAELIHMILSNAKPKASSKAEVEIDNKILEKAHMQVKDLLTQFPLYKELCL